MKHTQRKRLWWTHTSFSPQSHTHMHKYTCLHMHTQRKRLWWTHTSFSPQSHTHMHKYTCLHMHTQRKRLWYTETRPFLLSHTHTHTHTHAHKYIYTCTHREKASDTHTFFFKYTIHQSFKYAVVEPYKYPCCYRVNELCQQVTENIWPFCCCFFPTTDQKQDRLYHAFLACAH